MQTMNIAMHTNRYRHIIAQQCCRFRSSKTPAVNTPVTLQKLQNRSLIRVQGEQVNDFLQSLITNDMNHFVDGSASIFTMFLNTKGRILYDSIIYRGNEANTYLIECDKNIDTELQKHLQLFRVRKKISIDVVGNEHTVWVAFHANNKHFDKPLSEIEPIVSLNVDNSNDVISCSDPRIKHLGTRIIAPNEVNVSKCLNSDNIVPGTPIDYQNHRYRFGVGEGILEIPTGKSFPLESNCDFMHGVSFHKGCYLGQEFTARTHHTGVVRKRLMPIKFIVGKLEEKTSRNIETSEGTILGKVRGFTNEWGIGLMKFELALHESVPLVFGGTNDNISGITSRPFWWPTEAPKLQELKEKEQI